MNMAIDIYIQHSWNKMKKNVKKDINQYKEHAIEIHLLLDVF